MASNRDESRLIKGLPLHGPISQESLGVQLYQKLRNNCYNDSPAMLNVVTNESISFRDVFAMTCKFGEWLRQQGLKQDDMILICCDNVMEYFIPIIAALYSNIIVANANPAYSERELRHAIKLTRPKLMICSTSNCEKFAKLKRDIHTIVIQDVYKLTRDINIDPMLFAPRHCNVFEQVAVVMFSSGTSGLFKAVMLTHRNFNCRLAQVHDPRLSRAAGNSIILFLPFFHAFGFIVLLTDFFRGRCVHFMSKFDMDVFLSAIEKYKITLLPVVPPVLIMLSKTPLASKYDLSSVNDIVCGAAPLSAETEAAVSEIFPNARIRQGYGLTETTAACTSFFANDVDRKPGSCGTVMPGTEIIVRDPDTGASLGPHDIGEFCIKSEAVMKGYLGDPEATRAAFTADGFLRTGDVCYYDDEQYFYIVDRLKELIKYNAYQIAPAELEALLVAHAKVLDAAVIGKPDDVAGEVPLAFVVPKDQGVTREEIVQYVARNVSPHKALRGGVRFLKAIPKSVSGKILRRELREMIKTKSQL